MHCTVYYNSVQNVNNSKCLSDQTLTKTNKYIHLDARVIQVSIDIDTSVTSSDGRGHYLAAAGGVLSYGAPG